MVNAQWSMLNGQCSMVPAQWSMLNGPCSMVNAQWSMLNGPCSMVNAQWSLLNGQCSMVSRKAPGIKVSQIPTLLPSEVISSSESVDMNIWIGNRQAQGQPNSFTFDFRE